MYRGEETEQIIETERQTTLRAAGRAFRAWRREIPARWRKVVLPHAPQHLAGLAGVLGVQGGSSRAGVHVVYSCATPRPCLSGDWIELLFGFRLAVLLSWRRCRLRLELQRPRSKEGMRSRPSLYTPPHCFGVPLFFVRHISASDRFLVNSQSIIVSCASLSLPPAMIPR